MRVEGIQAICVLQDFVPSSPFARPIRPTIPLLPMHVLDASACRQEAHSCSPATSPARGQNDQGTLQGVPARSFSYKLEFIVVTIYFSYLNTQIPPISNIFFSFTMNYKVIGPGEAQDCTTNSYAILVMGGGNNAQNLFFS